MIQAVHAPPTARRVDNDPTLARGRLAYTGLALALLAATGRAASVLFGAATSVTVLLVLFGLAIGAIFAGLIGHPDDPPAAQRVGRFAVRVGTLQCVLGGVFVAFGDAWLPLS